jgi:hypothetical protein
MEGTHVAPDFGDAVRMHRLLDRIHEASRLGTAIAVAETGAPQLKTARGTNMSVENDILAGTLLPTHTASDQFA